MAIGNEARDEVTVQLVKRIDAGIGTGR